MVLRYHCTKFFITNKFFLKLVTIELGFTAPSLDLVSMIMSYFVRERGEELRYSFTVVTSCNDSIIFECHGSPDETNTSPQAKYTSISALRCLRGLYVATMSTKTIVSFSYDAVFIARFHFILHQV